MAEPAPLQLQPMAVLAGLDLGASNSSDGSKGPTLLGNIVTGLDPMIHALILREKNGSATC
jgi:hypothetical protein